MKLQFGQISTSIYCLVETFGGFMLLFVGSSCIIGGSLLWQYRRKPVLVNILSLLAADFYAKLIIEFTKVNFRLKMTGIQSATYG